MELKKLIKETVYKEFINGTIENLEIGALDDETGYVGVNFDLGGFHFFWNVNQKLYMCQHEPFCGSNKLLFEEKEIENICDTVFDYVKLRENNNKGILEKINELQAEINKLRSELII